MSRHQEMTAFLAVAESGSLAAAARRLDVSTAVLTRTISALEERLDVSLLERSTRGVHPTQAGVQFAADCRRIALALEESERSTAALQVDVRGPITLIAPLRFGSNWLMPIVLDYLHAYPDVRVVARFEDRPTQLHDGEADLAIVVGDLPDSSLFALEVGSIRRVVVASPAYLEQFGFPSVPADLRHHRIVHSSGESSLHEWRFHDPSGHLITIGYRPRLSCATTEAAIGAACRGAGVTRCTSLQAAERLASGALESVLVDFEPERLAVRVVYREGRKASARLRRFLEFAVPRLRVDGRLHPA